MEKEKVTFLQSLWNTFSIKSFQTILELFLVSIGMTEPKAADFRALSCKMRISEAILNSAVRFLRKIRHQISLKINLKYALF